MSAHSGHRWPARLTAGLAGVVLALCAVTAPASAHTEVTSTIPADQMVLQRPPDAVVVNLTEPALAMGTQVVVTGPSGDVQQGSPRLVDRTITQPLQPGAPAGSYTVRWRATSGDGHPVTGTFTFRTTMAGPGEPPAEPALTSAPDPAVPRVPGWLVLSIGAVAVGLAARFAAGREARTRR